MILICMITIVSVSESCCEQAKSALSSLSVCVCATVGLISCFLFVSLLLFFLSPVVCLFPSVCLVTHLVCCLTMDCDRRASPLFGSLIWLLSTLYRSKNGNPAPASVSKGKPYRN